MAGSAGLAGRESCLKQDWSEAYAEAGENQLTSADVCLSTQYSYVRYVRSKIGMLRKMYYQNYLIPPSLANFWIDQLLYGT